MIFILFYFVFNISLIIVEGSALKSKKGISTAAFSPPLPPPFNRQKLSKFFKANHGQKLLESNHENPKSLILKKKENGQKRKKSISSDMPRKKQSKRSNISKHKSRRPYQTKIKTKKMQEESENANKKLSLTDKTETEMASLPLHYCDICENLAFLWDAHGKFCFACHELQNNIRNFFPSSKQQLKDQELEKEFSDWIKDENDSKSLPSKEKNENSNEIIRID